MPDDRIAPWLALHSPGSVLHSPYYAASNGKKICTPYAARVCICIGITSTFHVGAKSAPLRFKAVPFRGRLKTALRSFAPPFQIEPAALGFDLAGDVAGEILQNFYFAVISWKSKTIYYLAIKMGAAGQDYKMNNFTAANFMPIFAMYLQLPRIV